MKNVKLRAALVAGLLLAGGVLAAHAAGMWSTLPAATSSPGSLAATTLPLTGIETGAFDTNLSGNRNPQTETISLDQIKTFIYGNSGGADASAPTETTAVAGAATCNSGECIVTSEALTTASNAFYTLTLSSSSILTNSIIQASVGSVTNTSTGVSLREVKALWPGATVITVNNAGGIAFNGTIRFRVLVAN